MRLALLFLLATVSASAVEPEAAYVLPGAFTRGTTRAQLEARYGTKNVVVRTLDGAEGETFEGIVLFPDDPERALEIIPAGERAGDSIAALRVSGGSSRWRLDTGVHLGMTLDALVALNGKPIVYSGLDWDYGGSVQEWNGGALEPQEGAEVFRSLVLTQADDAPEGAYPLGDANFRSDDPAFPQQGSAVRVGQIMVSFLEPSDGEG